VVIKDLLRTLVYPYQKSRPRKQTPKVPHLEVWQLDKWKQLVRPSKRLVIEGTPSEGMALCQVMLARKEGHNLLIGKQEHVVRLLEESEKGAVYELAWVEKNDGKSGVSKATAR